MHGSVFFVFSYVYIYIYIYIYILSFSVISSAGSSCFVRSTCSKTERGQKGDVSPQAVGHPTMVSDRGSSMTEREKKKHQVPTANHMGGTRMSAHSITVDQTSE